MEQRVVVVRHKERSMVQRSRRVGVVAVVAVGRNRSLLVDEGSLTFQERNGEFLLLLLLFCGGGLVEWRRVLAFGVYIELEM
jgi:hypothetical protein